MVKERGRKSRARSKGGATLVFRADGKTKVRLDEATIAKVEAIAAAYSITFDEALRRVVESGLPLEEQRLAALPKPPKG